MNGECFGNFGRFMPGKDDTIFGGTYDRVTWLQPVRLSKEACPYQKWSNFRYFRLLPWICTTGELCLYSHGRREEGVGVRIGG